MIGLVAIVLGWLGMISQAAFTPQVIGIYLASWFLFLLLVVAPARLWYSLDQKLRPALKFVDCPDNFAFDPNRGVQYARVTVENASGLPLTNVEVVLETIDPWPEEFMTLTVPLHPMHEEGSATSFSLRPFARRSVDLVSLWHSNPGADLWHSVAAVPRDLPLGEYDLKLVASCNEAPPVEQWFHVLAQRGEKSQKLSVAISAGPRANSTLQPTPTRAA